MKAFDSISIVRKLDNQHDQHVNQIATEAIATAVGFGLTSHDDASLDNERTLIVAVGGDGTMLYAARRALHSGASVLGFNTGKLGFLTDFSHKAVSTTIEKAVFQEDVYIEERILLALEYQGKDHYAMNEITVSNNESDKFIRYGLSVKGRQHTSVGEHKANCVIISTPTGSTAYSLNAGGAIVEPDLNLFQIIPVAAMSMTTRPLIVSGDKSIHVEVRKQKETKACIKLDGRTLQCLPLVGENEIVIKKAENPVKMIHSKDWNFFTTLTNKLHWNKPFN